MESTKPTLNEAENGNKSKPLLSSRLFRGFSKKNNCWVYGDLINTPEKTKRIINYTELNGDGVSSYVSINELVEYDSVGQFIGNFDKNADDICEGDIVVFSENEKVHIVKYVNTGFVLTASNGNVMVYNFNPNILKIIGNVFENPELL